jgi:peptide/nickel transport system substrate-binding protein
VQTYWIAVQARHMSRRRMLRAAAAGAIGGSVIAGCGRSTTQSSKAGTSAAQLAAGAPKPGGIFQDTPINGNPPHLDLQRTTSVFAQTPVALVMGRLMQYKVAADPNVGLAAQPATGVATSVESPDAITWTLKLRSDVTWHNVTPVSGRPFEAEDVKASWTRALTLKDNPFAGAIDMVNADQITTPDTTTVTFKLNYPFAPFPSVLAATTIGDVFPREALAGAYDPAKQVIGFGPFIFDHYTPDIEFVTKRNPNYYIKGRPYIDGTRSPIIPEATTRLAQFLAGHVDVYAILPNDLDTVRKTLPTLQWNVTPPGSGEMLWFQLGDPTSVYQDIRVRRAVSMAIDRQAIGKAIFGNDYLLGFNPGPSLGPKEALHIEQLPADVAQYYMYDPAGARKLLDAAGQANLQVILDFPMPYSVAGHQQVAETVASMLNTAGIKTQLTQIDYTNVYLNNGHGYSQGNFPKEHVILSGIRGGSTADPDGRLFDYYHSRSQVGAEHLKDPQLDQMIDKERTIVNQAERYQACIDIQQYIADKMYMVAFLPQPNVHTAIQSYVKNYLMSATNGTGYGQETQAQLWLEK